MSKSGLFAALRLQGRAADRGHGLRRGLASPGSSSGPRSRSRAASRGCGRSSSGGWAGAATPTTPCPAAASSSPWRASSTTRPTAPVRTKVVQTERDLLDTIETIVRGGMTEGQFREDCDPAAFAHDLLAIVLGYNFSARLLRDAAGSGPLARGAFERLLDHIRDLTPPTPERTSHVRRKIARSIVLPASARVRRRPRRPAAGPVATTPFRPPRRLLPALQAVRRCWSGGRRPSAGCSPSGCGSGCPPRPPPTSAGDPHPTRRRAVRGRLGARHGARPGLRRLGQPHGIPRARLGRLVAAARRARRAARAPAACAWWRSTRRATATPGAGAARCAARPRSSRWREALAAVVAEFGRPDGRRRPLRRRPRARARPRAWGCSPTALVLLAPPTVGGADAAVFAAALGVGPRSAGRSWSAGPSGGWACPWPSSTSLTMAAAQHPSLPHLLVVARPRRPGGAGRRRGRSSPTPGTTPAWCSPRASVTGAGAVEPRGRRARVAAFAVAAADRVRRSSR